MPGACLASPLLWVEVTPLPLHPVTLEEHGWGWIDLASWHRKGPRRGNTQTLASDEELGLVFTLTFRCKAQGRVRYPLRSASHASEWEDARQFKRMIQLLLCLTYISFICDARVQICAYSTESSVSRVPITQSHLQLRHHHLNVAGELPGLAERMNEHLSSVTHTPTEPQRLPSLLKSFEALKMM